MKKLITGLVVLLVAVGAYFAYYYKISDSGFDDGNGPICTDEAKACGDGTFVGRTGPNCEFAPCPGEKPTSDFVPTKDNPIQLPSNVISEKDCTAQGGEVWNTLGETSYNGELIGKIEGLKCPCACLVRSPESDILWVTKNGNKERFTGNLSDIKTFDDCKKAGFKIIKGNPDICQVGEPYMTGGKYKTFTNTPIKTGKTCTDYTYSTCPGSCVAICKPSSCGAPDDDGAVACTSDCDGVGSCIGKKQNSAKIKPCTKEYRPVCGGFDTGIRCIKAPCPSFKEKTYANICLLKKAKAEFLYKGKCHKKIREDTDKPPLNCVRWFDGCNTCGVKNGKLTVCTQMACEAYQLSKCLEFK